MSRIGKKPVDIPGGVTVELGKNILTVKGPKGQLSEQFSPIISVKKEDNSIVVERPNDQKESRALHGLTRALIQNMVTGVTEGYSKTLDIVGVGYKVEARDKNLLLIIGYSHPIYFLPPSDVEVKVTTPNQIVVSGISKQAVGAVAAKIRSFRQPEPYKGKGIKYSNEVIKRKAGKVAGK